MAVLKPPLAVAVSPKLVVVQPEPAPKPLIDAQVAWAAAAEVGRGGQPRDFAVPGFRVAASQNSAKTVRWRNWRRG